MIDFNKDTSQGAASGEKNSINYFPLSYFINWLLVGKFIA